MHFMRHLTTSLLWGACLGLAAQDPGPGLHWASEVDLLPVATGGWYASLAVGRNTTRIRLVAAEVHVPGTFSPAGWKDERTRAQALLVDRFFRPGFTGPWVGTGLERWDQRLEPGQGPGQVRLQSLQGTLGAGWVFDLGRGWTLNPWMAVHQRLAGAREASSGAAVCSPRAGQAEASVKIGYAFP